jgi:long-chain acyl-CoA synthetase
MAYIEELVTLVRRAFDKYERRDLFLVDEGERWRRVTYGEVADAASRLRTALAHLGVKRGDRVAIVSKNRPEWLAVMAATHALGATLVPMYEVQHEDDWRHILRDSSARVCFASTDAILAKVRAMLPALPALAHLVGLDRDAKDAESYRHLVAGASPSDSTVVFPQPGDLAAIIYTSGTTGKPKGVELSHGAFAFTAQQTASLYGIEGKDRNLSIFPWAHVGGFSELLFTVENGLQMTLPGGIDRIRDAMNATHPTVLAAPPRVWNAFHDAIQKAIADQKPAVRWLFETGIAAEKKRRHRLYLKKRERIVRRLARRFLFPKVRERLGGALRLGISGSAALSSEVAELFDAIGVSMFELYGQTEACAVSTANYAGANRIGTVGRPFPGIRIEIDRSVGDADDGSGEIILHTPAAMLGYHGMPDETDAVLRADGAIRTGDLGKVDEDGYLRITGRVREVYKLENGKFVTPVPIEESLTVSPFVSQAFVWGLNKPHNVALLVADLASLRRWCAERGVHGDDPAKLFADGRVRELFTREVTERTAAFKRYERIVAFDLLHEPFTTAAGLLTPTLKVKRGAVLAKYRAQIDALYTG